MSVSYLYRAVDCKKCKAPIIVEYLGPTIDVRIAGTISHPGQLRCQACGNSRNYTGKDIRFLIEDHPPKQKRREN